MSGLEQFYQTYPAATLTLSGGKPFTYRYYRNPRAKATLVLLTGGIGLSDLFYLHFERFAQDFSVITFDYLLQFADHTEFSDAVAELLRSLHAPAWLVGQSLGGIVAQIVAQRHPDVVAGLVLSNTCSLARDMGEEAYRHLKGMIASQRKSRRLLSVLPFSLYKRLIKFAVMKKVTSGWTQEEARLMEGLCDAMLTLLTKPYEYHMIDFLIDAENHFGMTPADFFAWNDRVLLILSEDDHTFHQACKDSLISIMPAPTVVTHITGGHLALLIKLDRYAETVSDYILQRT